MHFALRALAPTVLVSVFFVTLAGAQDLKVPRRVQDRRDTLKMYLAAEEDLQRMLSERMTKVKEARDAVILKFIDGILKDKEKFKRARSVIRMRAAGPDPFYSLDFPEDPKKLKL